MIKDEIRSQLEGKILPFWMGLKDETYGGFYGYMDNNLILNRLADKGCILNSRILWTFSTAALALDSAEYRQYADHAMEFLRKFEDPMNGGGTPRIPPSIPTARPSRSTGWWPITG